MTTQDLCSWKLLKQLLAINFVVNIYVCNDRSLITEYREWPTNMKKLTSNAVLPDHEKVRLRLGLEKNSKSAILNFCNIY